MASRLTLWLLAPVLGGLALAPAAAQIDPTLFGDHHGPAIADLPDTGDDWLVVDRPVADDPTTETAIEPEGGSPGSEEGLPDTPGGVTTPGPGANAANTPKRPEDKAGEKPSWFRLPWNRRGREGGAGTDENPAGARWGEVRAQPQQGGGAVDSGISPAELRRWKRDPREAMAQAREERRLLLLWMTDSVRSANSKLQAIEVFRHADFLRMSRDHLVLTKIDFAEPDIASHPYTRYLKEKLKVLGSPNLLLFSPDSEEVWRYRGYREGRFPEILDALRFEVKTHALKERDRHEKLVESGYRDWVNDRNEAVFARALEVSREDKTVLLVDENGERYHYPVLQLSGEDRAWLAERFLR